MAGSASMDAAQTFLRSLSLDEATLSFLCSALSDGDFDIMELQEFLEPYLSAADISSLLKLVPTSSQHHVEPVLLGRTVCARHFFAEEAECGKHAHVTSALLDEHGEECAATAMEVAPSMASLLTRERNGDVTELDLADHGASSVNTSFCEAGSLKKSDHVMIKDQPCRVMQISTSKVWKGPYRGRFQSQIVARGIFTGKRFEHTCPASQHVTMPFVKCEEYQIVDIGDDGELSLLTATCEMKVDVNLPTQTDADHAMAASIKTGFSDGKTVVVIVQCACGIEKVIKHKVMD